MSHGVNTLAEVGCISDVDVKIMEIGMALPLCQINSTRGEIYPINNAHDDFHGCSCLSHEIRTISLSWCNNFGKLASEKGLDHTSDVL